MQIEKIVIVDQITAKENGCIEIRVANKIVEDGKEINRSFHRYAIAPGQDYSAEDDRVKAICQVIHTPEVIAEYRAMLESNRANLGL